MKYMKKIMALVIAMVMVLGMSTMAMADETTTTYTVAVKNEATGFTYQAHQIFTGDLNGDTLSNVQWGSGISDAGKAALRTKYSLTANSDVQKDARAVAEAIAADTATDKADAIATLLAKTTSGGLGTSIAMPYSDTITVGSETFKGYAATAQNPGWYLIVNTGVPSTAVNAYSDYIVEVVKDVAIAPKSEVPSSEKKVQDINDSDATPTPSGLQDSADYDIGDEIPYTLTFTLPQDYAKYDHYYVKFYDDMSKGLTYKTGSTQIKYGNAAAVGFNNPTAGTTTYTDGGHMWTWEIMDLKAAASGLAGGDVITLTYKAILNGSAVIGSAGNPNKMQVEFSNNSNNTGDGSTKPTDTGFTVIDLNIVFTYQTIFNKVQPDDTSAGTTKPLTGADFKLEKKVNGVWVNITSLHTGDGSINPTKTGTTAGSTFTFAGLDDGDYKLTEITTPDGFNTIDPIEFTITAEHTITSDSPQLEKINGSTGGTIDLVAEPRQTATVDLTAASITSDVLNNKGAILPSTGGIGTTIFYVIGAILVLGAGILLVSKRRMSAN